MAGKGSSGQPGSVAEGLGDVIAAIGRTLTAPDATAAAGPLMKLQMSALDIFHQLTGQKHPAAPPAGGPPPGAAPGAPPAGGPPLGQGLVGGLAGLQGQPQGPSGAASGGMNAERMRELVGANAPGPGSEPDADDGGS